MDEKKPKKRKPKLYPGMKKQPRFGPKPKKKVYGPFSLSMKIKPGMSDHQKRTMIKFMEVRPGETLEQWRRRTATRRVKDIDEIDELSRTHKLKVLQRSRERNAIASKNKYIKVQPVEREFDFMRYYGIVINFYAIKYGIRKEDLEVGFYFYSNIPFTKDRFDNALVLMTGSNKQKLYRFIKEGLVQEVTQLITTPRGLRKYEKTDMFKLTKDFVSRLTFIYRTLGKMNAIVLSQPTLTGLAPEVKQIIADMNDEIQDIQTGRKPQDLIKKE